MSEKPIEFWHLPDMTFEEMTEMLRSSSGFSCEPVTVEVYFSEADAKAAAGEKELREAVEGFPPLDKPAEQAGEAGTV